MFPQPCCQCAGSSVKPLRQGPCHQAILAQVPGGHVSEAVSGHVPNLDLKCVHKGFWREYPRSYSIRKQQSAHVLELTKSRPTDSAPTLNLARVQAVSGPFPATQSLAATALPEPGEADTPSCPMGRGWAHLGQLKCLEPMSLCMSHALICGYLLACGAKEGWGRAAAGTQCYHSTPHLPHVGGRDSPCQALARMASKG